jgi:diacylglycerol kinase
MKNKNLIASYYNAFNGLKYFFSTERNGKIQFAIAILVLTIAALVKFSSNKFLVILLCIGLVIGFEIINTAIEILCNLIQKNEHPQIKIIKDVAAGAVLLVSLLSILIAVVLIIK